MKTVVKWCLAISAIALTLVTVKLAFEVFGSSMKKYYTVE